MTNELVQNESTNCNECPISALETFTLDPHSETIVIAKVNLLFDKGDVGLILPNTNVSEGYSILDAFVLITTFDDETLPLRLVNLQERQLSFSKKWK